jgi:hypothetical protein
MIQNEFPLVIHFVTESYKVAALECFHSPSFPRATDLRSPGHLHNQIPAIDSSNLLSASQIVTRLAMNLAPREVLETQLAAVQVMTESPRQNAHLANRGDDVDFDEVWERGLCQLSLLVMI